MKTVNGVMLSNDLSSPDAIPYFLWDEPMTVATFRERLQTASVAEQTRLLAKLLREARDTDVWLFISPAEVWQRWTALAPQLGRLVLFGSLYSVIGKERGCLATKQLLRVKVLNRFPF